MIRIGMVGSDNSHALAFSRLANVDQTLGDRCRVVGLWGSDPERTGQVARDAEIGLIAPRPEDLVGQIDLAMVVDRHGTLHAGHALPFLDAGIPVFVDKPFAIDPVDCWRMLNASHRSGAALTSFSALRYAPATDALVEDLEEVGEIRAAHFAGPCDFGSEYGGPYFYATHIIEIALRLIGEDVEALSARRSGATVAVRVIWASGALATFSYLGDAAYRFHAAIFGTGGMAASEIPGGDGAYAEALRRVVDMALTGQRPLTDDQLLRPIAIVHAIEESLRRESAEVSRHDPSIGISAPAT